MKRLLSILLLVLFLFPVLTRVWVVLDFKINQDFITDVFCINKDKPVARCNGKCHLAKQLKKVDDNEQKEMPNSPRQGKEIPPFILRDTSPFNEPRVKFLVEVEFCERYLHTSSSHIHRLFRPPKAILYLIA